MSGFKSVDGVLVPLSEADIAQQLADAAATPSVEQDISEKLQEFGLTQEWLLHSHMAGALAYAMSLGMTEEQAYAVNPAYRKAKDAVAWIADRRAKG